MREIILDTIEKHIVSELYFTAADGIHRAMEDGGKLNSPHMGFSEITFCVLTVFNGVSFIGIHNSPKQLTFSAETSKVIAREEAIKQLYSHQYYTLATDRLVSI